MSSQLNVAIFWDYENCEIPAYTDGYSVANGIRRIALEFGSIKVFKAYIETSEHNSPRALTVRSELTASGVSIIDCPHNGRKDVADKMLIVDMLAYAMDTPAPATVILISGDGDFVHALALLRHRRYNVVVIAPTLNNTHTSLRHQAMEIYDWCQDILPNAPRTPASAGSGRSFSIAAPRTTTLPATLNSSRPLRSAATPFVPSSPLGKKGERPESPLTPQDDKEVDGERQPLRLYDAVAAGIKFDSFYAHISAPSTPQCASLDVPCDEPSSAPLPTPPEDTPSISNERPGPPPYREPTNTMIPLSAPPKASSSKDVLSVSRSGARNVSPDPQRVKPIERPTLSQKPLTEITPSSPSPSLNTLQSSNTVYRLKNPPKKFEPLVRALESQRLQGVTRIASSQLGMVLKPAEYTTGEITSLKKYTSLAEAAGVVILGADQENGNRWIALHPAFHGMSRKPENALPPTS